MFIKISFLFYGLQSSFLMFDERFLWFHFINDWIYHFFKNTLHMIYNLKFNEIYCLWRWLCLWLWEWYDMKVIKLRNDIKMMGSHITGQRQTRQANNQPTNLISESNPTSDTQSFLINTWAYGGCDCLFAAYVYISAVRLLLMTSYGLIFIPNITNETSFIFN